MQDRFASRLPALASSRLPLSRAAIDRDYLTRTRDDLFEVLLAQSETRVLTLWKRKALMAGDSLALLTVADLPPETARTAEVLVYLGRTISDADDVPDGTPIVAAVVTDAVADLLDDGPESWGDLRKL